MGTIAAQCPHKIYWLTNIKNVNQQSASWSVVTTLRNCQHCITKKQVAQLFCTSLGSIVLVPRRTLLKSRMQTKFSCVYPLRWQGDEVSQLKKEIKFPPFLFSTMLRCCFDVCLQLFNRSRKFPGLVVHRSRLRLTREKKTRVFFIICILFSLKSHLDS